MHNLVIVLIGLVVLALVLALVSRFLPRHYRVERSTAIRARPEIVFAQVADLRAWKNWSVWFARDPRMRASFSEPANAIGSSTIWKSRSQGGGMATLTALTPPTYAEYRIEFDGPGSTVSQGNFTLTREADGIRLVWASANDLGKDPLARWFGLFSRRMIGADCEAGLAKLKTLCEKNAANIGGGTAYPKLLKRIEASIPHQQVV